MTIHDLEKLGPIPYEAFAIAVCRGAKNYVLGTIYATPEEARASLEKSDVINIAAASVVRITTRPMHADKELIS